jgi:hypothetical protein
MRRLLVMFGLAASLAACGSDEMQMMEPDPMVSTKGTVTWKFKVSDWVRQNVPMGSSLKGTVYGDLFLSEDVTLMGPLKEAMAFGAVEVKALDLKMNPDGTGTWTSPPLLPERYTFLGFFDVDDKSMEPTRRPAAGDPVTLPITNRYLITAGQNTDGVVLFDLVFN